MGVHGKYHSLAGNSACPPDHVTPSVKDIDYYSPF